MNFNDKDNIISIDKGAQFHKGNSFVLLFVIVILLIFIIISLKTAYFLIALLLLLITILTADIMFDFQGCEVNLFEKKIRTYKKHIWGKNGIWNKYENYKTIILTFKIENVQETSFSSGTFVGETINAKYKYYHIILVNEDKNKNILLKERVNYKEAKDFAIDIANKLNLPFVNVIQKRKTNLKRRRL